MSSVPVVWGSSQEKYCFCVFSLTRVNVYLWETYGILEVDPPPDGWSFNINLICLGSSPPAMGKAGDFLFPARGDEEVYTERLPLSVKCLIQKAFISALPSRTLLAYPPPF